MPKEKTFPESRKNKAHNLPAKRVRPKGGRVTEPIRTSRHGRNGSISIMREMKKIKGKKSAN